MGKKVASSLNECVYMCVRVRHTLVQHLAHLGLQLLSPTQVPGVLNDKKYVIAAVKFEAIKLDKIEAIKRVSKQIEQQFQMVNPKLSLIPILQIVIKFTKLIDDEKTFCQKQLTTRQMKNFAQKLPKLFDAISCRCKILACSSPDTAQH